MLSQLITLLFLGEMIICNCFTGLSSSNYNDRQVYVIDGDDDFQLQAKAIASSLSIPHTSELSIDDTEECYSHALRLLPFESDNISTFALGIDVLTRVESKRRKTRQNKKQKSNPFYIDFCPPKNSRIEKRGSRRSGTDLLIQAVAPRSSSNGFSVLDLTAGFGQDSLILALNGASKVRMVERDPIVFALLEDAIRRINLLSSHNELAQDLSERLSLRAGDGIDYLKSQMKETREQPDVCYLDPMFPPRTKSSAVKKGMQILHGLLDTQQDDTGTMNDRLQEERQLLDAALEAAKSRVVVKRPIKAPPLGEVERPSYAIKGSVNRWDIYVI